MVRRSLQGKQTKSVRSKSSNNNTDVREFYVLEKLYEAMRNDKNRGKNTSAREFYLLERLYEAMRNDKNRNKKLNTNEF